MSGLSLTCLGCSTSVLGDKFCINCGLEVIDVFNQQTVCPKCHIARSLGGLVNFILQYAQFCGNCGYNFGEVSNVR